MFRNERSFWTTIANERDAGTGQNALHADPIICVSGIGEATVKRDALPVVLTVGDSTRPLVEFTARLAAHSLSRLIAAFTVSRSRHNPNLNRDTLPHALKVAGHATRLGRLLTHPSWVPNGWQNAFFRDFATTCRHLNSRRIWSSASNRRRVSESHPCVPKPYRALLAR